MFPRAIYRMETEERDDEEELEFFEIALAAIERGGKDTILLFNKEEYEGEWLLICSFWL